MTDYLATDVEGDKNSTFANVFTDEKSAPLWEQAMVTLWFLLTYLIIPGTSALLYLLVLALMGILVLDRQNVLPVVAKTWPLYVLPIFGIISFLWSPHPAAAFRSGVLYLLTPLTVIIIVARMDIRHALRCMMFAGWIATIFFVLPYWSELRWGGMFGSKNQLAMQMAFMTLLSIAALLNKRELPWVRLATIPFIPIGFMAVVLAESATSLVFVVLGPIALLLTKLFWVDVARFQYVRIGILLGFLVLVLAAIAIVISIPTNNFEDTFLRLVGRERNLSGRTMIWMAGRVIQDQHPVFGTGLAGFWNPENGAAQSINYYDLKPFGTKLTFHNSYMEVRVHLGWIGFWMFVLILTWCGFRVLKTWLQSHHMEASLIVVTSLLVFASTFTESSAFSTFTTPVNLLYLGAAASLAASRKRLVGRIPVAIVAD